MRKTNETKTVVGNIDPDVLAFTVGNDHILDRELIEWDCLGTAAHVSMLTRMPQTTPLFTQADRNAVVAELSRIANSARAGNFVITEVDQDGHLAIERVLTERLGDIGKRVHTGRSRNDQIATAIRLYGRDQLLGCMEETIALATALLKFAKKHVSIPMVGRTHLQPAMPSSVGLWASCYAEGLLDDLITVWGAYDFLNRCPLGSAAGYGVPLPIDRPFVARVLGFREPVHNVMYAGNTRGKTESVTVSALTQIMLTLSRFAEDLILFTMPEFGYFNVPKAFCTGSSIMPQKYNLDVCELIRAKSAKMIGRSTGIAAMLKATPGGYNRDMQDTKEILMDAFNTTRTSLRMLTRLVPGLTPVPKKLRNAFEPGVFAADRALELVAGGMPFRDAYHQIRNNLDDLAQMNPDDALAAKTHLGAPAGLDFDFYTSWVKSEKTGLTLERRTIQRAFTKLMKPVPEK